MQGELAEVAREGGLGRTYMPKRPGKMEEKKIEQKNISDFDQLESKQQF